MKKKEKDKAEKKGSHDSGITKKMDFAAISSKLKKFKNANIAVPPESAQEKDTAKSAEVIRDQYPVLKKPTPRKRLPVNIEDALLERVKDCVVSLGMTLHEFITDALEDKLKEMEEKYGKFPSRKKLPLRRGKRIE